jgi:hypothetical protein
VSVPLLRVWRAVGVVALELLVCVSAHAQASLVLVRVTPNACPDAALLQQKLSPLATGDGGFVVSGDAFDRAGQERATVRDLGGSYVIEIDGLRRELVDGARDCVERARVAAVLIALNSKQATPPKVVPAPETPAPLEPPRLRLGMLLFGEGAYASETARAAPGVGAGVWLQHRGLRLALTTAVVASTAVDLEPTGAVRGSVALMRLPLVLSASYLWSAGRLQLGPTLGLDVDVLRLRGVDVVRPQTALRVNPGVLVGADANVRLTSALSGVLRLGLDVFPRAYNLSVDPIGRLGRTPRLWLGAELGLAWRFG